MLRPPLACLRGRKQAAPSHRLAPEFGIPNFPLLPPVSGLQPHFLPFLRFNAPAFGGTVSVDATTYPRTAPLFERPLVRRRVPAVVPGGDFFWRPDGARSPHAA